MKKLAIMAVLAAATLAASATEFAVNGIRDTTNDNVTGYDVGISQPIASVKGLSVQAGFENTAGKTSTNVDTYMAGVSYDVASIMGINVAAIGQLEYIDHQLTQAKGTAVQYGVAANAPVPFTTNLAGSLTVLRQLGTSAVNTLDNTSAEVGLHYQATKAISVNGSETFYDNIPGAKMSLGVSYAF